MSEGPNVTDPRSVPISPSPRQTLSFLMRRFEEAGIRPHTKFGQNFLIDLNLQRLLLDSAQLEPQDVVLEIGTGTGSLAVLMAQRAGWVVTVEIDPQMSQLASEELFPHPNVTMLRADALRNKNQLNPVVVEAVEGLLHAVPGRRFKVAANLPYNVATPILTNLLAGELPPQMMVVTIQKELAERITARPSTKEYGALSIWIQSQCEVEIVRILPPSVFWPRPKVSSAIVRITLSETLRDRIPDRKFFHGFTRAMFFHRRKFLRSELLSAFKKRLDKPAVDEIIGALHLPFDARAEQLEVAAMLRLCEAVRARLGN